MCLLKLLSVHLIKEQTTILQFEVLKQKLARTNICIN